MMKAKNAKERIRRSMLFVPGNNPSMIQTCPIYGADTIILDLEDSVAPSQKDAARRLVVHAIRELDFSGAEIAVRINAPDTDDGKRDIEALKHVGVQALLVPKAETAEYVAAVDRQLGDLPIALIPMLETPAGVLRGSEIAASSDKVVAIAFGAEDYATSMGIQRTKEGCEVFTARCLVTMAARACGVAAIDTVFVDVNDEEGLAADTREAIAVGFEGKLSINPRQVEVINREFTPTAAQIDRARRVVEAYEDGIRRGLGAIALDGKMIDMPVVQRAQTVLKMAKAAGCEGAGGERE